MKILHLCLDLMLFPFEQAENKDNMEQTRSEFKQSIEKLSTMHCDSIQEIKAETSNRLVSAIKDLEMQLKHPIFLASWNSNNKFLLKITESYF